MESQPLPHFQLGILRILWKWRPIWCHVVLARAPAVRLVDLLPVVRNNVYHPDFGWSFGLKQVLPALVPELGYGDLAIDEGGMASLELERLLFQSADFREDAREKLRKDLLRYCGRDTLGLVQLLRRLRQLANG